ncbi:MAG: ribose-5-phosphate isomerase RpiA [Chitinophagaceae bacterium]
MSLSSEEIKKLTGEKAATFIKDGMTIGVGTGSTAYWFILALAQRIKQGLHCIAVPTSERSRQLAADHNIPLTTLNEVESIDITVDGADEIDPQLQLIKGGGGALLQEKMVAAASKEEIIIVDYAKLVPQLGAFPLPVEVIPYGYKQVQKQLSLFYKIDVQPRMKDGQLFITDHQHYILDCHFGAITDVQATDQHIKNIPGVVETGLFINMATRVLAGYPDGSIKELVK